MGDVEASGDFHAIWAVVWLLGWKCSSSSPVTTALFDTFAMTKFPSNRGWQAGCSCRDAVRLPRNAAFRMLPRAGGRKWPDSNLDCDFRQSCKW